MRWAVVVLTFNPSTEAGLCKFKAGVVYRHSRAARSTQKLVLNQTTTKFFCVYVFTCDRLVFNRIIFSIFTLCECRCVCASQTSLQESLAFIYKVSPGDGTRDVFRGGSKHLTCWALTPALSLFFFFNLQVLIYNMGGVRNMHFTYT